MTVREYIGARYVPVFADPIQWDSTLSYEPLTVVTNQGTSYVSRQSVPPGIEVTNETYWVRWADYNAQLEEYIRQVQTYSASISALNDALPIADFDDTNTVDARFDTIEDMLPTSAFDSTNTVDARFDAIEGNSWVTTNRVADGAVTNAKIADGTLTMAKVSATAKRQLFHANMFNDKESVCFGDSNGVGQDEGSGMYSIYDKICKKLGCRYHNFAVNSATWQQNINVGGVINDFRMQIANATIAGVDNNDVALVVIIGGINDFHYGAFDTVLFPNAITATIHAAHQKYPNAMIVTIFDAGHQMPNWKLLSYQASLQRRTIAYTQDNRCANVNVPTADLCCQDSLWRNQNHYNDNGTEIVAARAVASIFGGTIGAPAYKNTFSTPTPSNTNSYGYYGYKAQTFTEIDPYRLIRHDRVSIRIEPNNFGHTTHTYVPAYENVFELPCCYLPNENNNPVDRLVYMNNFSGNNVTPPTSYPVSYQWLPMEINYYNSDDTGMNNPKVGLSFYYNMPLDLLTGKRSFMYHDFYTKW